MFLRCRKMPNPFRNNDLTADYIFLMERLDPRRVCDSRGVNFSIADDPLRVFAGHVEDGAFSVELTASSGLART